MERLVEVRGNDEEGSTLFREHGCDRGLLLPRQVIRATHESLLDLDLGWCLRKRPDC